MSSGRRLTGRQRLALGLALAGGLVLALSVATTGKPITPDTAGALALAVGLLLILSRSRRCTRCGKGFVRLFSRGGESICPRCAPENVTGGTILAPIVTLLILMGALATLIGCLLATTGVNSGLAYAIGGLSVCAFFAALLCANRDARVTWARLCRALLRQAPALDLAAARKASGREGRIARFDGVVAWADSASDIADELRRAIEESAREFPRLTGLPGAAGSGLRLFCFESEGAFQAYTAAFQPNLGRVAGWYGGLWSKRIALCRELAEQLPSHLGAIVAHEMAHHLLRRHSARGLPPWLDEGIAVLLAQQVVGSLAAPGARLRWAHAASARGELLSGARLLDVRRGELSTRTGNWRDVRDAAFVTSLYIQSGLLVAFLRRTDEGAFERLLAGLRHAGDVAAGFGPCFALTPDDAAKRCLDELLATPLPLHQPPPADLRDRIEKELVEPIQDRAASADDRRMAIRRMGALGYPWRADALIETLTDTDESLRAEAQRALEDIAGELHGSDPQAWRQWLDAATKSA